MKIKNKLLILLVISFMFIMFFNVKEILAVNVTVNSNCPNSNSTEMTFPEVKLENLNYWVEDEGWYDLNSGYIVQYDYDSSCYYLYIFRFYEGNYFYVGLDANNNNAIRCKNYMTVYKSNGSTWDLSTKLSGDSVSFGQFLSPYACISLNNPIYLNCDVYSDIDKTGFFFPEPIPEIPEVPETPATTIPALETVEQIPTAMVETLKLIIPVGLVIFGIVLLISLIKSVISRMT